MLNSRPNNKNYDQGNYIPKYKDKVLKLNTEGGVYYRSGWEKKIVTWLDNNKNILKWGSECISIPYQMTEVVKGILQTKSHVYYADYYYEMRRADGTLKQVVIEVKPSREYNDVQLFSEGKFEIKENMTSKQLVNLEYRFKMAQRNKSKWETMIAWCERKGYEFIIITEDHLKKFNL